MDDVFIKISLIAENYGFAFDLLNSRLREIRENPTLVNSNEWIIGISIAITLIRSANEQIKKLEMHHDELRSKLTDMAASYGFAVTAVTAGLDTRDPDIIIGAADKIKDGNLALKAASRLMRSITRVE